jgi:hypothetical protein
MTAQLELAEGEFAVESPPGSPEPLVRALAAGLPDEPATVASLDEARLVAIERAAPGAAEHLHGDNVIPLKAR